MVSCKHCATPNSLDSTFCKKCGTPLPDEDLKAAAEKLEVVVSEGVSLFNAGKVAEAMDVAEAAVLSNPSSIAALALKGDCHAQRGEISEAIECYEQIVALNPESTLDKIRLNQLRNTLVLGAQSAVPDRRLAIVGAVAAIVLVVSVTAIFARTRTAPPAQSDIIAAANQPETPAERAQFYDPSQQNTAQTNQNQTQPSNQQSGQAQGQPQQGTEQPRGDISLPPAPNRGTGLPRPNEGIGEIELRPMQPPITGDIGSANNSAGQLPPVSKNRVDEDPQVDRSNNNPPAKTAEPADTGEYNIDVRGKKNGGANGSTPVQGSATGVQALMNVGRQQYQLGNYAGAAASYEKALAGGGDAVSINQRLGQAYERLGRSGDAAGAYQRAMTAAEAAIASGKGDPDRLQAVLESCRQALKVLGG